MDSLHCFNCLHRKQTPEDYFNVSQNHKNFVDKRSSDEIQTELESEKENTHRLICADCVYDRLQQCKKCSKKEPLCMFKVGEWFLRKEDRKCIDCAALDESKRLLSEGFPPHELIRQCFSCSHFKYLPSFITADKREARSIPRDCFECQLKHDIDNYKKNLQHRYELKLQQEPVLGNERDLIEAGGKSENIVVASYASVVTKGSGNKESDDSESLDTENGDQEKRQNGGSLKLADSSARLFKSTSFTATLYEPFCHYVLQALKMSFGGLEEKTRLELQLLDSNPEMWQKALKEKLIRVSQCFSSQATDLVSFETAESRWAYIGTYTAAHASLLYSTLSSGCLEPLTQLIQHSQMKQRRLHVCCVGAGPGSEILGLHQLLPASTEWLLLDSCEPWIHSAEVLLGKVLRVPFRYGSFDAASKLGTVESSLPLSPTHAFRKANIFVFCKFVSAVQNLPGTFKYLADILRQAREGAMFLFIDNVHLQTKSFIEELVFPGGIYTQHKGFRESDAFKMYTTYAELKSGNDINLNSSLLCEWVGLISCWLDRYPMLDLRVNVMLAVKKDTSISRQGRASR